MKSAFFALALVLVSSSAFATSPELTCQQAISMSAASIIDQAQSFAADVENMERMQIQQDGHSSLSGDTLGRAERAREIADMVVSIQSGKAFDVQLSQALCDVNLNVSTLLAQ